MPVTPFHLGPAMVLKALAARWFSLGVFAVVQIAIDVEPVANIIAGRYPLHGAWHTIPGSLVVAAVVVVPARYGLGPLYAWLRGILLSSGRAASAARVRETIERSSSLDCFHELRSPGFLHGLSSAVHPAVVAELAPVPWTAALVGAAIGAVSHVWLDAVIHGDVRPLAPLSDANPLFVAGSFGWVHLGCVVAGAVGLVTWWVRSAHLAVRRGESDPGEQGERS